jgi:hypothetical protein
VTLHRKLEAYLLQDALHIYTPCPTGSVAVVLYIRAELTGLRRKLEAYLSPESDLLKSPWDIGECVGSWVRPNFDTMFYPYTSPHITRPKEIKKVYIVQLPENCYFGVSGWGGGSEGVGVCVCGGGGGR